MFGGHRRISEQQSCKRRAAIFPFDARTAKDIGINPVGLN
jgi:hypothetical protein